MKKPGMRLAGKFRDYVIAAYISGTMLEAALVGVRDKRDFSILFREEKSIRDITSITDFLNTVKEQAKEHFSASALTCVIGSPGPVFGKRAGIRLTNSDIDIEKIEVQSKTGFRKVLLLNNYEAVGYGIDFLNLEEDVIKVPHVGMDRTWPYTSTDTVAVVGIRTGLGLTIAPYDSRMKMHRPMPSEGGHTDTIIDLKDEIELLRFLREKSPGRKKTHPEYERVLSDRGLVNIFDYYARTDRNRKTADIGRLKPEEKVRAIETSYHLNSTCRKTIDRFTSFYARFCKNIALTSECYSGLFMTDRIVWNNIRRLDDKRKILMNFMKEFEEHEKESEILAKIPVYLIKRQDIRFLGCCNAAVNFFGPERPANK